MLPIKSENQFLMSEFLEKIPFEQIGQRVGIGITIYFYYRVTIIVYRKAQELITKYKEKREKNQIHN